MAAPNYTEELKFTDQRIADALKHHAGEVILKDADTTGLQVVRLTGTARWRYYRRIKGRLYNRTLGDWPSVTTRQARALAVSYYHEILKGNDPLEQQRSERAKRKATATTLQEALDLMLGNGKYTNSTLASYRRLTLPSKGLFAQYANRPLIAITPETVQKLHSERAQSSPAEANKHCRVLSAVWNYAADVFGVTVPNPVAILNSGKKVSGRKGWAKVPRRRTAVLQRSRAAWIACTHELQQFKHHPTLQKQAIAAEIMVLTGLRRSACLGMRWEWIDFKHRTITIPGKQMKAGRTVSMPITHRVLALLQQAKPLAADSPFVFPSEVLNKHGDKVRIDSIDVFNDEMHKRCGLRHPANDLRRTFQTTARAAGVSSVFVKVLMAHSYDENDVTEGYQADDPDLLAEMAQRIEDYFLGKSTIESEIGTLLASLPEAAKQKLLAQLKREGNHEG